MQLPRLAGISWLLLLSATAIAPCLAAPFSDARPRVSLSIAGQDQALRYWEEDYLANAVRALRRECKRVESVESTLPAAPRAELTVALERRRTVFVRLREQSESSEPLVDIREVRGSRSTTFEDCDATTILPVTAIMEARVQLASSGTTPRIQVDDTRALLVHPESRLTSYEPNRLGWTHDENSVESGYMDAVMSFKYRMAKFGAEKQHGLYFAFTTRFSQYIETISSSPVVGKRYNPALFTRWTLREPLGFLDLGYAHESNGQSITNEASYLAERASFAASDGDPDFARNYISRGWDYALLDWTNCWAGCSSNAGLNRQRGTVTTVGLKYFLDDGLFQGNPEEYNVWENDGRNLRKEYDGVSFQGSLPLGNPCTRGDDFLCNPRVAWHYTTGYDDIFSNNTNRLELSLDGIGFIPTIVIWGQTGYNSSLVDYYRKVDSWGVAAVFRDTY